MIVEATDNFGDFRYKATKLNPSDGINRHFAYDANVAKYGLKVLVVCFLVLFLAATVLIVFTKKDLFPAALVLPLSLIFFMPAAKNLLFLRRHSDYYGMYIYEDRVEFKTRNNIKEFKRKNIKYVEYRGPIYGFRFVMKNNKFFILQGMFTENLPQQISTLLAYTNNCDNNSERNAS